jgi:hypothetical protein
LSNGNFYGGAGFTFSSGNSSLSYTNSNFNGEINITKFDTQNQIVSGTFWMNLQHPITGDTVKITEGRFDTRFGL